MDSKCVETCNAELEFLHPMGSAGHVLHFCVSGARNVDALFFMIQWNWFRFHKMRIGTRYAELVFLHLVGSVRLVVNSSASGPRNSDTLFSCLGVTGTDSTKCASGHITPNLCFCIRWHMRDTLR
jgi:hypothetical protein